MSESSERGLLRRLVDHGVEGIIWIQELLTFDLVRQTLRTELGLAPDTLLQLPPDRLDSINRYRQNTDPHREALLSTVDDLLAALDALGGIVEAGREGGGEAVLEDVSSRLLNLLAMNVVRRYVPGLFWVTQPLLFAEDAISTYASGQRYADRLVNFFAHPWDYTLRVLALALYPGIRLTPPIFNTLDDLIAKISSRQHFFADLAQEIDAQFATEAGVKKLSDLLWYPPAVGLAVYMISQEITDDLFLMGWDPDPQAPNPLTEAISARTLSVRLLGKNKVTPSSPVDDHLQATMMLVPREHGGKAGLMLTLGGAKVLDIPLNEDWTLTINLGSAAAVSFFLGEGGVPLQVHGPADARASFALVRRRDTLETQPPEDPNDPATRRGTRFELGRMALTGEVSPQGAGIKFVAEESALVIDTRDGDGFLQDLLPAGETRLNFTFGVGFSTDRGLYIEGGSTLQALIPVGKTVGPVHIHSLLVDVKPSVEGQTPRLAFEVSTTSAVKLGPLTATIDRLGFTWETEVRDGNGLINLRPFLPGKSLNWTVGFKPPTGIGLAIDSEVVVGGGFLFFDPQQGHYAGVAQLAIHNMVSVKALGLLSTKLPGGAPGYALLLIITAEGFRPIPLGFGFMLTGFGGLLGVHRTANTAALQAGVRNRTLDAVLFPKNLLAKAPQYLSTLNTVFPPARDHFLFGLAAQITWGTPKLVTINLMVILELSDKADDVDLEKCIILGQLSALLPDPQNELVRLQMDAIGIIDFKQKTASLDARLYDSRLARQFAISGDMAMRMRWGQQPSFALAVGGFHPAFTPPAGFPALQRATLSLANSENLQMRCEAYLAITSNTVQFGSRTELLAKAGQAALHGEMGYDVLVQFDPFHFIAAFHASVQITYRGRNLLRVALQGELSGPRPLRVRGKATFEILWFDVSVSFDHVLVSGVKPPLPAPVEVLPPLQEALRQPASWQAALPGARLVTLRESAAPDTVTLHPLSTLSVRQNVVPLNLRITRFGNTRPSGAQEFRIQRVAIGGQPAAVHNEPLREFFAPAQFREMSDDEKLSAPAFQALPAGVQFSSGSLRHGTAVVATLEAYEEYIIPQPANAPQSGQVQTTADLLTRFGHLSAVGSNAVRRTGRNKYQAKAIAVASTAKAYTLTSTRDLAATTAQHATWTEASAALWHLRNTDPEQARDLQIVTV